MANTHLPRIALIVGITLLLIVVGYSGYNVHLLSQRQKVIKEDYSIANSITFGILSVNKWRDLMVASVSQRIENFQLTAPERDSLEKEVVGVLNALITKADSLINRPQKSVGGKIRKLAFKAFVNEKELRESVPSFSRKIIGQLMKPQSRNRLAYLAKSKLEDLGQDTYDSARQAEHSNVDSIYQKYGVDNGDAFDKKAEQALSVIRQNMYYNTFVMLGGVLILLVVWLLLRGRKDLFATLYGMSILMALILLLVGITSTMIEIDARINTLSFQLIGETISFKDQVIFFQSKSIVDVVALLIRTGRYDSILVGVLILCFSIIFPVTKLASAAIHLLNAKYSQSGFVRYFAFHSSKWSMADVMVVAIFMAYIGFNGILNDQMSSLNFRSEGFTSIATNRTSLQPGYIVFIGFVLFGLFLSQVLKWNAEGRGPSLPGKVRRKMSK